MQAWAGDAPVTLLTERAEPGQFLKDGQPKGFMADLVAAIGDEAGDPYGISILPWKRALEMAQEAAPAAVFPTTRTPER